MDTRATRVDMHVHSSASARSRLGVQRSLALPECATAPSEVYELAKRAGMDFVTLTDHDTIDGALALAHLPDTFISVELTAHFKGEPQAVHVLCYGITGEHHEWLQAHADDVETCAAYLGEHEITCALAHPFYAVSAPLTAGHRRRLAQLFGIWETRNGSRAKELNMPAFVYIETHGGIAIGGSDDHAGIDIGRTFTQTPPASSPREFLDHIRAGRAQACGAQGSAAKWTHAAVALAIRSCNQRAGARDSVCQPRDPARAEPAAALAIVERVLREGDARAGAIAGDLGPADARALLAAWLASIGRQPDGHELLAALRDGRLEHGDLARLARGRHERALATVTRRIERLGWSGELGPGELRQVACELFDACVPAIPYAAASAFLGREKLKLARSQHNERPRVALICDGLSAVHGVAQTIRQIRERGVSGFEVEVIGTDADVDRRCSAVAEIQAPFYPGLQIGVPSLSGLVEQLAEGAYDLVHVCAPGPAGACGWLLARMLGMPLVGSYHTQLDTYVGIRSGRGDLEALTALALARFYSACDVVLSPSPAADRRLAALGVARSRIARWDRGVDHQRFSAPRRMTGPLEGELKVLYAGRLSSEKGVGLLAEAFCAARERDSRLHLVLAGGGPEEQALRRRLGPNATFLGWLEGDALACAYASADIFAFASATDTFGQAILEAQASGLPVVAVGEGGPAWLVEDGRTGLLCQPDARELADALVALAGSPQLRQRLGRAAAQSARRRSWERSLERLSAGYRAALALSDRRRRHAAA
jgi:glycosyltransferase involved in cell wall biosynthesis/predicted metal-dependent phosphoesterase TrpH